MGDEQIRRDGAGRQVSRRSILAGTAAGMAIPVVASSAAAGSPVFAGKPPSGQTRLVKMHAEELPGNEVGYGLESEEATVPGPTLEMWEGDTLEIELTNNTDRRLSIHPHGVNYDTASDGSPLNGSFNEPGQTRTYVWSTTAPSKAKGRLRMPGSAGYWHYHDHAMGGGHGTEGIRRGLYGSLIVRRQGDIEPDRQFTIVFNDMTINNKKVPEVPLLEARLGERVEFIAIGHGNLYHTFHLHAHRWADNRTGMLEGPHDHSPVVDNKDLNPGGSFGFQVIAGDGVGPGVWMYHCHVQFHADDGMVGIFLVRNEDGSLPEGAQEALDRYFEHDH